MLKPYNDYVCIDHDTLERGIFRYFNKDINDNELVWHRDKKDRVVKVLYGNSWFIQFENELPKQLNKNDVFTIKKMIYHRLLKGKTKLMIFITGNTNEEI
jgi:hypothetical protein